MIISQGCVTVGLFVTVTMDHNGKYMQRKRKWFIFVLQLRLTFCLTALNSYCLYAPFCIFRSHRANWHSPTTLTEVLPCFFFPQLQGRCQGIPRKAGACSTIFLISELCCSMYCLCRLCCSVYCLYIKVYRITATGCKPNCS